ncbi:basic proline-rich protein-like [Artibeus jamaicensis]|uniref:basic proline-rich protein-like n=1 Tax=Artibeus jamaicensis TaxID=9417 RepID=UPI00235A80E5|nr:basic proline-rich protein-like [Artibeus jamaicensis]
MSGAGQKPRRLGLSGLVQSRLGKRLHYLLLRSPRPQMQGSRLPPGEGSPGRRRRCCPPSFPPSLRLVLPPSFPPSRAAAHGALPRATCSGPDPGISERVKKEKASYVQRKERPLTAFIFHAPSLGRPRVPTSRPRPCPRRGVRGLPPRPLGPPRPTPRALHTLGRRPAAAQTPPRPQGPAHIRLSASRGPPPRSPLRSVRDQSPRSIHLVCAFAPGRTALPAEAPTGAHSGCGPARDPHKAPSAAPSPSCRCPSPVSEKGCIPASRPSRGPQRRVLRSRGPREVTQHRLG